MSVSIVNTGSALSGYTGGTLNITPNINITQSNGFAGSSPAGTLPTVGNLWVCTLTSSHTSASYTLTNLGWTLITSQINGSAAVTIWAKVITTTDRTNVSGGIYNFATGPSDEWQAFLYEYTSSVGNLTVASVDFAARASTSSNPFSTSFTTASSLASPASAGDGGFVAFAVYNSQGDSYNADQGSAVVQPYAVNSVGGASGYNSNSYRNPGTIAGWIGFPDTYETYPTPHPDYITSSLLPFSSAYLDLTQISAYSYPTSNSVTLEIVTVVIRDAGLSGTLQVVPSSAVAQIGTTVQYAALITLSGTSIVRDVTTQCTWTATNNTPITSSGGLATSYFIGTSTITANYYGSPASATLVGVPKEVFPQARFVAFDTTGSPTVSFENFISASFEDLVNGGSGQGTIVVPRYFIDVGWFDYDYRVQFYLKDSIDPWYDGRIVQFDQLQETSSDRETVTVHLEGWATYLANSIVTETLSPGVQPNGTNNGTMNADTYLIHLLSTYVDGAKFGTSLVSSMPYGLDKLTFDGTQLNSCIDEVVKQIQDNTGNTFEWWARGTASGKPAIVIQPNQNPNKITSALHYSPTLTKTPDFFTVFKNSTIYDYQIQNSSANLFNQIALYGGPSPTTGLQVYGAFKDSTSISLYGLRQKKVTNNTLLSSLSLTNYATVYLLLNAYPQPQGSFKLVEATDVARAGQWFMVREPGIYGTGEYFIQSKTSQAIANSLPGNVKQFRSVKVVVTIGQSGAGDRIEQQVYVAAPRPYIDHAYYSAISKASNTQATISNFRSGTQLTTFFIASGMNYVSTVAGTPGPPVTPPTVTFGAPSGLFVGDTSATSINGSQTVPLQDSITNVSGDGVYSVVYVKNQLAVFGGGVNGPAVHVVKGVPNYDERVLPAWRFTLSSNAIVGTADQRIQGGVSTNNGVTAYSIYSGNGVPTFSGLSGDLYQRRDGSLGARLYVSQGGINWNAVAGV